MSAEGLNEIKKEENDPVLEALLSLPLEEMDNLAAGLHGSMFYPINLMRRVSIAIKKPLMINVYGNSRFSCGTFYCFPKELEGNFSIACKYRPEFIERVIKTSEIPPKEYNYFNDFPAKPGEELFVPSLGSDIMVVCEAVCGIAKETQNSVPFKFNEISVVVSVNSTPTSVHQEWRQKLNAMSEAYRNSPEAKERELQQKLDSVRYQQKIDDLLLELDEAAKNPSDLIVWVKEFTLVADSIGVKFDKQALVAKLANAGWVSGAFASNDPKKQKSNRVLLANHPDNMAKYIVGQVMSCLEAGMPPHPITLSFVEKYEDAVRQAA